VCFVQNANPAAQPDLQLRTIYYPQLRISGGLLLESIGGRGLFLVFGIIILTGMTLIEIAKRLLPERNVVPVDA
jgi:hypothetical protein